MFHRLSTHLYKACRRNVSYKQFAGPRKPNFKDLRVLRDQSENAAGFDIASRYVASFCPCRYLMGMKVTFGI